MPCPCHQGQSIKLELIRNFKRALVYQLLRLNMRLNSVFGNNYVGLLDFMSINTVQA